ncbi:MAG TPA: hypothetical protein VFH56_16100, partial [Acidimicrobiales bacterium]|nr:hypothetical protein [Acidimicrobiales bacterium]
QQLKNKGLDKSEIVARLTHTKDNAGGASQLSVGQLRGIGFSDDFIMRAKGVNHLPPVSQTNPGGFVNRHAASSGGSHPASNPSGNPGGQQGGGQQQPASDPYTDFLKQQAADAQLKYNQNAIDSLTALFHTYGLDSLAPKIAQYINAGMSESAIVASLRETPEYKQRFPGMEALKKQGYNAISEAQYLQLEDSYHQALQGAGLPKGFYDSPQDFVGFISNGVDPAELKQRADKAVDLANQVDPTQRQLLSQMYGVGRGDIAAYLLDPKKAMPLLQKQLSTVGVASAAEHAGIHTDFGNAAHFQRLVDNGIGVDQAAAGYSQIAQEMDPLKNLANIWGGDWSLNAAEDATFFGNADAQRQKKRLIGQEQAAFSGASGFNPGVSGQRSTAGQF